MAKKEKGNKKKGLTVKSTTGLNKQNYTQKGGRGDRVVLKEGATVPVQFLHDPSEAREFDMHRFRDGNTWNYVPCLGDDCPLCDDEDQEVRKTSYQFIMCVYNHKEKKVQVLRGPKDMAGKLMLKYERKPEKFLKRVWDITAMPGNFVTYDIGLAEDEAAVKTTNLKLIDLDEYLESLKKDYFGDNMPSARATSLDKDDDDDDDDDDDTDEDGDDDTDEDGDDIPSEAELKKLGIKELRKLAEAHDIDTDGLKKGELVDALVEESEDDEDDDEDDDDEDDDDEGDDDDDSDDDEDDEDDDDDDDEPKKSGKASKSAKPAKKAAKTAKAAKKKK